MESRQTVPTSNTLYSRNLYITNYIPTSILDNYNGYRIVETECSCGHPEWHSTDEISPTPRAHIHNLTNGHGHSVYERMLSSDGAAAAAFSEISLIFKPKTTTTSTSPLSSEVPQSKRMECSFPSSGCRYDPGLDGSSEDASIGMNTDNYVDEVPPPLPSTNKKRRRDEMVLKEWEVVAQMDPKTVHAALVQLLREQDTQSSASASVAASSISASSNSLTTTNFVSLPSLLSRYNTIYDPRSSNSSLPSLLTNSSSSSAHSNNNNEAHLPISPRSLSTLQGRDWNKDFQTSRPRIVSLESERERLFRDPLTPDPDLRHALDATSRVLEDFFYAAKAYARIIISEFGLPDDEKTISRVNIGGIAGGEKYIAKGILFKFAQDKIITNNPHTTWMYGGDHRDDSLAIKAAGKEFLALNAFLSHGSGSPKLLMCPSLMMIIDYKGFRLIATPLLPIDKTTIVYGSNDSGLTVHTEDPLVNEALTVLATRMNIKPHKVGPSKEKARVLSTAGDFEVHKGRDGGYYAVDFGRFLPPEAPCTDPNLSCIPSERRSVFYKFLRPEFTCSYSTPLSPDAFSAWSLCDDERLQNERNLRAATETLYNIIIPKVAEELERETEINFSRGHTCLMQDLQYEVRLISRVRFHGVNLRHLGRVRRCLKSESHRKLVLSHCIGRVIKNLIHEEMRSVMRTKMGTPTDLPFRCVVTRILNLVLGRGGEKSTTFWNQEVKRGLQTSFHYVLDPEESETQFDLRTQVDLRVVLFTVTTGVGIVFRSDSEDELMTDPSRVELLESDISELLPRTRQPFFSYTHSSTLMRLRAYEADNEPMIRRLLMAAHNQVQLGSLISPKCPLNNIEYASLDLTFIAQMMKQYLLNEPSALNARWAVEWLFDSAFTHTEESISGMAFSTNLQLWCLVARKYRDWKIITNEKDVAQVFEAKSLELEGSIITGLLGTPFTPTSPSSSSSSSSTSSSSSSSSSPSSVSSCSDGSSGSTNSFVRTIGTKLKSWREGIRGCFKQNFKNPCCTNPYATGIVPLTALPMTRNF